MLANEWLMPLWANIALASGVWILSVLRRNAALVDMIWSLMFVLAAVIWFDAVNAGPVEWCVLLLVMAWGFRLHVYLVIRNSGEPEDRRYQAIRKNNSPGFWWKSYFIVFLLQAVLAWIASLVIAGAMAKSQAPGWLVMVGLVIATAGFFVEAVADWQLARFKANLANAGKVMDLGLWRYSRHPNYFGECCFWWGIALVALVAGYWWTLISPLLMTVLLLRVSGVTLLEKDISERRPAYRDYIRRTSAFIPRRPLPVSER